MQVKTLGKSKPEVLFFLKALFHCLPSLHLKGTSTRYQMSEKDHIVSLYGWVPAAFCMRNSLEHTFLTLLLKKLTVPVELYIVKTT
jgi:hypothetical protein